MTESINNNNIQVQQKNSFSIENELLVARQIQDERNKLEFKFKKEGLKQTNQLKNLLVKNDEKSKQIMQLKQQNAITARKIQDSHQSMDQLELNVKEKQQQISQLSEEFLKIHEQKFSIQDQGLKQKIQYKNELMTQQNINKLLVKYTRLKFGQVNENYVIAFYLSYDEKTIPIYIDREKKKSPIAEANDNEKQEKIFKTDNEIAEELHQRISEIQIQIFFGNRETLKYIKQTI